MHNNKGIEKLFDLNGKAAVITGASGALGRAVSLGLAAYGADIVLCDLEEKPLREVSERIRETGQKVLALQCDVTDPDSVDLLVKEDKYRDVIADIPLGRAAVPEDFIGATVFLASGASSMVTGHALSVDGGVLIL